MRQVHQKDHPTFNYLCKEKSKDIKCVLCEGNHPANYKDCMVFKNLQRSFFPTLWKKVIASEPGIEFVSIQTRLVQDPMLQSQELKVDNQLQAKIIRLYRKK